MSQSDRIAQDIAEANTNLAASVRSGSARAIANLYTEAAILLPPDSEEIAGRDGIADFWEMVLAMGVTNVTLETVELEGSGETAVERGRYSLFADGGVLIDRGKYVVVWKRTDGQWKIHRDIWNSSLKAR